MFLYNIVHKPHEIVANVINQVPLSISFQRALNGDKLAAWHNQVAKIVLHRLSDGRDTFTWDLHRHNYLTVRSMHQYLLNQDAPS
jgi:hypothetical protein